MRYTFTIIFTILGLILGMTLMTLSFIGAEDTSREVDCFDKRGNVIKDLTCIQETSQLDGIVTGVISAVFVTFALMFGGWTLDDHFRFLKEGGW